MTLDVYATGSTTAYNFDVPTNPLMTTQRSSTSYTTGDVLFSAIYTDDSEESAYNEVISSATLQAEYENLSVTKGYNIHCFDTVSSTGVSLATIDAATGSPNINTHYYFVLIHSDDHLKHHFARITEIKTSDVLGDSFDFEPKLGNEIAQGTKFKLYKGPAITSKGVAFSAGIKQDLKASLHVARPHFWFVDSLDKKDELDHNTKYFARVHAEGDGSSVTLNSAQDKVTFVTVTNYGQVVVDYSKYSLNASISDNLRTQDAIATYTFNESGGGTPALGTQNDADYDTFAPNARRDTNNLINDTAAYEFKGPTRYLHYDYSPTKNNSTANIVDLEIEESIGKKSGFAEVKIADSYRILSKKINTHDPLRIRHMIHRGDFNDWVSLGVTISAFKDVNGDNESRYDMNTPVDLTIYFNVGDEVLVGSTIYILDTVESTRLRFKLRNRAENESSWAILSSNNSIPADTIVYRRAWNTTDGTLLTGMKMLDSRQDNLYVSLISDEFSQLEAEVTSYVGETGLLTLSFATQAYDSATALDQMTGQYIIYNEKLNGRITRLRQEKEGGQTIMLANGADKLRELLDPIIEKNTLFSKDIVYSTNSPYNKLTALGVNLTTTFDSAVLTVSGDITLTAGEKIFAKTASGSFVYLGDVNATGDFTSSSAAALTMVAKGEVTTKAGYKASTKYTVFNKALSTNSFVSSSTSLYGTANKGLFFESGTKIVAGAETENLTGSSINTANPNARGYYLSEAKNMKSDELFQARLDDNASSKSYATFDTINTLIDFNILSIEESNGNQIVEIAPHIPLALGRVEVNWANTQDVGTTTSLGNTTAAINAGDRYIVCQTFTVLSNTTDKRKFHGNPVYLAGTFVGYIIQANFFGGNSNVRIYVDRDLPATDSGTAITTLAGDSTYNETTKLTHELALLNGAHLHGGKIIGPLHPTRNATASVDGAYSLLDMPLHYGGGSFSKTLTDRNGSPHYRIINLEKGIIHKHKPTYSSYGTIANLGYYEDKPSKVPYYASSYKFNPGFYIDSGLKENITGVGKTDDVKRLQTLIESRGYYPPSGSMFFDTNVHGGGTNSIDSAEIYLLPPDPYTNTSSLKTPYVTKDILWQPDTKISRMFLFVNSDLIPYSSTRKDSLLNTTTRDITKYNLLALTENSLVEFSETKDNEATVSKTVNFKDGNYSSSSILSSEKTLSSLTRFGLMRLTELCFDWAFNQFDPENPPSKNRTLPVFYYPHLEITSLGTIASISGTDITYDANISSSTAVGNHILDSEGRFIGTVGSIALAGGVTVITCSADAIKTNGNAYYNGAGKQIIVASNEHKALIRGHGSTDSFTNFDDEIHMLRSAAINFAGTETSSSATSLGYGDNGTRFAVKYGRVLGNGSTVPHDTKKHNTFSPIDLDPDVPLGQTGASVSNHPSKILELFDGIGTFESTAAAANAQLFNKAWLPVFLDRFSIEDGTSLADAGMVGASITGATMYSDTVGTDLSIIGYALSDRFADKETNESVKTVSGGTLDYNKFADGVMLAFKPRLKINVSYLNSTDAATGNTTIKRYFIPASGEHTWLKFVNLTGTYLASSIGSYVANDGTVGSLAADNTKSLFESVPTTLAYVISHEIDRSNGTETHIIVTDRTLATDHYRILQPNHTCTYEFSPKNISLNTLSSEYTKKPYEDSMYEGINAYQLQNAMGDRDLQGNNEGILSMYVAVDIENLSSAQETIVKVGALDTMLLDKGGRYCMSDGQTTYATDLSYNSNSSIGKELTLGEMKETLGVVSVSEITSLTIGGESPIDTGSKRAMIGSVVSICNETEDLLEELFEEQNTSFAITREDYPLFVAPNFDGISLFQAINFLLQKKDKTLIQTEDTFTIKNKESSDFYTNLLISDNGDIRIYEYQVLDSTFDEYNEIIVHGKSHKSKRQDFRSVKKIGRKSLKVFERKLSTQEEVDTRAKELLRLHQADNKKLKIKVGHANISQIKVGDIVDVEIKQENIPRNQYLVLEITHSITGLMELELGKYTTNMEDRFSELSIDVDTAQTQQNNTSNELNIGLGFLETIKIKPLRLLVRKRTTTGSMTLGFTTALNTGTAPLGFTGGASIVYTDLVEEEF